MSGDMIKSLIDEINNFLSDGLVNTAAKKMNELDEYENGIPDKYQIDIELLRT